MTTVIEQHKPYTPEETEEIRKRFDRDGFCHIPGVLSATEVAALKTAIDRVIDDPAYADNLYGPYIGVRLFEIDPAFEDMLAREPIISLVESILGPDCHLVAENVVRNPPGNALDFWHADDLVIFPLPDGIERHDARLAMPVFILTVQIPLTDIPSDEYGPTQYVPGSHYAGRQPAQGITPQFEGQGPVSVLAKAGDIYLHNGQCWHQGSPNTSDRTRYLLQLAYGQRWVSQRFYPFVNYQVPAEVEARADERTKRILGFHPKGAYG